MAMKRMDPVARPVLDRLERAVRMGIDETTAAAAIYAKQNHPTWQNRTGTLEGSIRMDPAQKVGPHTWRGRFGSFDVMYAKFLELGTRFIAAGYFLRNAADVTFPTVGQRIARYMR